MYLRRLEVRNFRNYSSQEVNLSLGLVVFYGPNGAGKTNLLEAISLTAVGESPRAREASEMVRLEEEYAFVRAHYQTSIGEVRTEVGLARAGQKQIKVNGVVRRRADLIGLTPVVYFSADDIMVLRGEPSGRRRLLDTEISALSRPYYSDLSRYRRTLEQRNRLLKDLRSGRGRLDTLDPWDRAAARYGARVMAQRWEMTDALGEEAAVAHTRLTGDGQALRVMYRPSIAPPDTQLPPESGKSQEELVEIMAQALEADLRSHRQADLGAGATTLGPHRDDFEVLLNERPLRTFGSQGQQRAGALAVRLGLAALAEKLTEERPVLLLDDVLSELDVRYREGVFTACRAAEQALITSSDLADVPEAARELSAVFEVSHGRLV